MAGKKKSGNDERQQIFQFIEDIKTLAQSLTLEGGNQENLSEFEFRFRQALKVSIEDAGRRNDKPLDREAIAAEMTRILGRDITKTKIDQWTALSCIQHRIHVDALKALCDAIGDFRPFHVFVEACGFKALSPTEAKCAEYGAMMLAKKALDQDMKTTVGSIDDVEMRKILQRNKI